MWSNVPWSKGMGGTPPSCLEKTFSFLTFCVRFSLSAWALTNANLICARTSHKVKFIYSNGKSSDRAKPPLHGLYASEQLGLQPGTNFPPDLQLTRLYCRNGSEQGLHHKVAWEDAAGVVIATLQVKLSRLETTFLMEWTQKPFIL